MFEKTFEKISSEVSAERAFDHVVSISQFHRIQASPGFRKAADYCVDRLLESSPTARVFHYPAESGVRFWHFPSFEEWSARTGVLEILSPRHLAGKYADYGNCPISIIQRSRATPAEGITAPLVYAGEGKTAKDFRGARGKIAVCDSHCPREVYDAATRAGVIGIVLYRQRPLPALRVGSGIQGARQYNSFWWDEKDLFGFVLTPEDGQRLVAYLQSPAAKTSPVKAWAAIEAETYPGSFEVVTSHLPGSGPKEIAIVAHLCHPKPSSGDNASGVAAAIEAHRVLSGLIGRGELPEPRHGIRFILVPEMTGTFAFLSRQRAIRRGLLAGLNLDMVGQRQDLTGSTLCIESPPLAASSFAPFLLEEAVRMAFTQGSDIGGASSLLSVRVKPTPFSGGSDHAIMSDPTVGIPTPMLIQWPDKYYHTSADTPDKVSPDVLRRIVTAASCYAYTCALAPEEDILALPALTGAGLRKKVIDEIGRFGKSQAGTWIDADYKGEFLLGTGKQALRSIVKLLPGSAKLRSRIKAEEKALAQCVRREIALWTSIARMEKGGRGGHRVRRAAESAGYDDLIVKRKLTGPADAGAVLKDVTVNQRRRYWAWVRRERRAYIMGALAQYWANGARSISEISRLIAAEIGYSNPEFLRFYFGLLEEAGVVEIGKA